MCGEMIISAENMLELTRTTAATAEQLTAAVQQLGVYVMQLDARLRQQDELLARRVTVTSAQSKRILAAVRARAEEVRGRYDLPEESRALIRKAIRCEILERCGIRDLHDLPESRLDSVLDSISRWDSYRLVREIRNGIEGRDNHG